MGRSIEVGVVGTGHVGLPTAATLATLGHHVVATDAKPAIVEALGRGELPFYEPGLDVLVREQSAAGRLAFSSDVEALARRAEVVFLCVGTPPRATGETNLLAVEESAEAIARHAEGRLVIVEKSTVPAGTADRLTQRLSRHRARAEFALVCNPEFLREGSAIEDSLHPARIVVGSDADWALELMRDLFAPLVEAGAAWIETDLRTAELAKHASNAFLAMKISYVNAMARLCEIAGADVGVVAT
jgi:UDPglucose 6-dehydrogenase